MAHPHALSVSHLHNNFGDSHEGDKREKMQMQLKLLVKGFIKLPDNTVKVQ